MEKDLRDWVTSLSINRTNDLLQKLQEEGISCLDHLQDLNFSGPLDNWPLADTEKTRFRRILKGLFKERGWDVNISYQTNEKEELRKRRHKQHQQNYIKRIRDDPKKLEEHREKDKRRKRKDKSGKERPSSSTNRSQTDDTVDTSGQILDQVDRVRNSQENETDSALYVNTGESVSEEIAATSFASQPDPTSSVGTNCLPDNMLDNSNERQNGNSNISDMVSLAEDTRLMITHSPSSHPQEHVEHEDNRHTADSQPQPADNHSAADTSIGDTALEHVDDLLDLVFDPFVEKRWCSDPTLTKGGLICTPGVKFCWEVQIDGDEFFKSADILSNGNILCCSSICLKLLSKEGRAVAMPFHTYMGKVDQVSINTSDQIALLREDPGGLNVYTRNNNKWNFKSRNLEKRPEKLTWTGGDSICVSFWSHYYSETRSESSYYIHRYQNDTEHHERVHLQGIPSCLKALDGTLYYSSGSRIYVVKKVPHTLPADQYNLGHISCFCFDLLHDIYIVHQHTSDSRSTMITSWSSEGIFRKLLITLEGMAASYLESICFHTGEDYKNYLIVCTNKQIMKFSIDEITGSFNLFTETS